MRKGGSFPKGTINTLVEQGQEQVRLFKPNAADCCIYCSIFYFFPLILWINLTFFVINLTFLQKDETKGMHFLEYISFLHLILQALILISFSLQLFCFKHTCGLWFSQKLQFYWLELIKRGFRCLIVHNSPLRDSMVPKCPALMAF